MVEDGEGSRTVYSPDDVGKIFTVRVAKSTQPDYFVLDEWKPNGKHIIRWLYRHTELLDVKIPCEIKNLIRRVEKIGSVPLFYVDHHQSMDEDCKGGWTEKTDRVMVTRSIPCKSVPIDAFIIGEYSLEERKFVTDTEGKADFVINQLLSIGPKGGEWPKSIAHKITEWKKLPKAIRDTCVACERTRAVTQAFRIRGSDSWHVVGCYCGDRMRVACDLIHCKVDAEREDLMYQAALALDASRTSYPH